MDQSTYTQLSGKTVTTARFNAIAEVAQAKLESMLGWPLNPSDWDNQYIEIGKALNECSCPSVDTTLTDPDEVVGSYRLFSFKPSDVYIAIDPATAIHAVKLVRDNVTYRDLVERQDYAVRWVNGSEPFSKYLFTLRQCACFCDCRHWDTDYSYQVAVDADWAFEELPATLNPVLVDLIGQAYDLKSNIKSESITSHSYTKFDQYDVAEFYSSVLAKYAGPNGSVKHRAN